MSSGAGGSTDSPPQRQFSRETLAKALQDKRLQDAASRLGFDLGDPTQLGTLLNKAGVSVTLQDPVENQVPPPSALRAARVTPLAREALRHYLTVANF